MRPITNHVIDLLHGETTHPEPGTPQAPSESTAKRSIRPFGDWVDINHQKPDSPSYRPRGDGELVIWGKSPDKKLKTYWGESSDLTRGWITYAAG